MSEPILQRRPLVLALVASLLLHAGGALWLVSPWAHPQLATDATADSLVEVSPNIPRLGIEHSKAVTVTWVGFETPTEHQAKLSEVEQAALTPVVGQSEQATAEPSPPVQTSEPSPNTPPAQPQQEVASAKPQPAHADQPVPSVPIDALAPIAIAPPTAEIAPTPKPAPAPKPAEQEAPAPTPAPTPSDVAAGKPGLEDEREADPVALAKPVRASNLGKPLAGEGIQITTVSPTFGTAIRMLASPSDPLVIIDFAPDGSVQRARYARSGKRVLNTGNPHVDGAILDAVYRWTAKGKAIDELKDDESLTYSIRLLLRG